MKVEGLVSYIQKARKVSGKQYRLDNNIASENALRDAPAAVHNEKQKSVKTKIDSRMKDLLRSLAAFKVPTQA